MAILTLDDVIAGMQPPQYLAKAATPSLIIGRPQSLFYLAGAPGAGSAPGASLAGAALNSPLNGTFGFVNGAADEYLARWQAVSSVQSGVLLLCDRLWHNGGINITSNGAQTVNSVAFPARDNNGSANGEGVFLGVEVAVATGAAAPTMTVSYTNELGTAGRSATNIDQAVSTSPIGAFYRIGLAAGDRGVRSVQTLTLSTSWLSGTINLVAYRPVAALELIAPGVPNAIDAITSGMPKLHASSCLWPVFIPSATAATMITGQFIQTNG